MASQSVSLVVLIETVLACSSEGREALSKEKVRGNYSSVTEADCNVELELLGDGKARVVQTCRLEDGSHRDAFETTSARWSVQGTRVIVEYGDVRDYFDYDPNVSYGEFGEKGSGPGLKLVQPTRNSRLAGYGHLWKRPLPGEQKRHERSSRPNDALKLTGPAQATSPAA